MLLLLTALPLAVVPLVSFDGAPGTTFAFKEIEDSVMGSRSWGNWTVGDGTGTLAGVVTIVQRPAVSIVGASPGFVKAGASGQFADASSAVNGSLVLVAKSDTRYHGFRVAFASDARFPGYSCEGGGQIPLSRGCYKSDNFTVPETYSTIRLPFSTFSDRWAPPTGEHTHTCREDSSACVTSSVLSGIQRIELWAEGADGNIRLQVKSIAAEP
jgi:hypothetical protein